MNFSSFRKLDYIIFYIISVVLPVVQVYNISFNIIIGILILSTIPAFILGTITNLIFRKDKSQ